jgi:hypothetical protein
LYPAAHGVPWLLDRASALSLLGKELLRPRLRLLRPPLLLLLLLLGRPPLLMRGALEVKDDAGG